MKKILTITAVAVLANPIAASAMLIDRGSGLVYDTDLDVTWMQNASFAAGSAFDDGVDPNDGYMTWASAMAWADSLVFGGFDDWRLPTTLDPDSTCTLDHVGTIPSGGAMGWNCSGSELGHLYYETAALTAGHGLPENQQSDVGVIHNVVGTYYWSSTRAGSSLNDNQAFIFAFNDGEQGDDGLLSNRAVWAVRDGDVVGVPEPGTLALFGFSLAGLGVMRRRYRS